MARAAGNSEATVRHIWSAQGLKPHLVRTFELSRDPRFQEKLEDIIGLYLNPPEYPIVLCADEESRIQAPDYQSRRHTGEGRACPRGPS